MKIAVLAFSSKKTVTIKWYLSENLTFRNLLKSRTLIPAEKFQNLLAFDRWSKRKISEDSFIKINLIYVFRVEIFLCFNGKFFDFKKFQILWIFSCNKCILLSLWVKVFVSQGWVHWEIAVHTL